MFAPPHYALTFTPKHVSQARKAANRPPFDAAWQRLDRPLTGGDSLEITLTLALRWRFKDDADAAEQAVERLRHLLGEALPPDPLDALAGMIPLGQCIEMLRDHTAGDAAALRDTYNARMTTLEQRHPDDAPTIVQHLWLAAARTAAGIVLEDEARFETGTAALIDAVDNEVHPEGYLRQVVTLGPEARALHSQVLGVQALTLIAEMADHVGRDLWRYEKRGVGVTTATTYPLYYYFYPEKWLWSGEQYRPSEGVNEDDARRIFNRHNGFLELANRRYDKPLHAIQLMLTDMRPVFDRHGGGHVTLTHALPERRGLFR